MSNIKKYIILGLGAIAFIIGFFIISFIVWLLLIMNNPETPLLTMHNAGAVTIIGLALIAIGSIVMLFTKRE